MEFSPLTSRARACAAKLAICLVLRCCCASHCQRYRAYGFFPHRSPSTERICYCTPLLLFCFHWFCADHAPRSFSTCFIILLSIIMLYTECIIGIVTWTQGVSAHYQCHPVSFPFYTIPICLFHRFYLFTCLISFLNFYFLSITQPYCRLFTHNTYQNDQQFMHFMIRLISSHVTIM